MFSNDCQFSSSCNCLDLLNKDKVKFPSCAVVEHDVLGPELILMGNQLIDIYNLESGEWRHGPPTTLVSLALVQKDKIKE